MLVWAVLLMLGVQCYWLADIEHQGIAPYVGVNNYKVFRNVKDYGVTGDGKVDDAGAINDAISAQGRYGDNKYGSTAPGLIYFPTGVYLLKSRIVPYYYTELVGDPTNLPTLKSGFDGWLIDCNPYKGEGNWWINQDNFFKQIRNFIIDLTDGGDGATGIHWQVSQATLLQNIIFNMKQGSGQSGIFDENGSGGFMCDLIFNGGGIGANFGNQQFTSRNLTFNNCKTAMKFFWDWSWTFVGLTINNCSTGFDLTADGIGSVQIVDAVFTNVGTGIISTYAADQDPISVSTIVLENVDFTTTNTAIQKDGGGVILAGGKKIGTYIQGNTYNYDTSQVVASGRAVRTRAAAELAKGPTRPSVLVDGKGNYIQKSKPQYESFSASQILSVRSAGAKGDGQTDDTAAIQALITKAAAAGAVVWFDHGAYIITDTIYVPPNSRIQGEVWALILASGPAFRDEANPTPVFRVGKPGEKGVAELSDLVFTSQTENPGAVFVEWNIHEDTPASAGLWDVHFRVGSTAGSEVHAGQKAAHTNLHVTASGSAYLENNWIWLSDHNFENDGGLINIYSGRGVYIESQGPLWAYAPGPEHHILYNFQLANAKNIFVGFLQIETPYFQANPNSVEVFTPNKTWNDPDFADCDPGIAVCKKAWALRIVNSSDVYMYGGGFYTFFDNNDQDCLDTESCQQRITEIDEASHNIWLFSVSTIGTEEIVSYYHNGEKAYVAQADNTDSFASTIGLFKKD